jgi:hypothetical protein
MNTLRQFSLGVLFTFLLAVPVLNLVQPTSTAQAAAECEGRLLGIPPWYRGLTGPAPECAIISPTDGGLSGNSESEKLLTFITIIALNIIEMIVVITAYVATFFILYGGFLFITGGSNSSSIEKARHSILNAVIGLAIALSAVGILNLIYGVVN